MLDLSEYLLISPGAPVTYLHPARLIRTDMPNPGDGLMPEDSAQHGAADAG